MLFDIVVNSHVLKHSIETDQSTVNFYDLGVLETVYCLEKFRRKLSEALFIKQNKTSVK